MLTLAGETDDLEIKLKVPNLVMQNLYVERIHKILLTEPEDRDAGKLATKKVYQQGNIEPLCNFVENHFFKIFKNRDYRWANELTLKTAFLTLLYNDIIFIMDSETEIFRRYAAMEQPLKKNTAIFVLKNLLLYPLDLKGSVLRL